MASRTLTRLRPAPGFRPTAAECDAYADALRDLVERSVRNRLAAGTITPAGAAQELATAAIVIQAAKARIDDAVWFGGALN